MSDFNVSKFQVCKGPNFYLDRQSVVFNLSLDPESPEVSHFLPFVSDTFPTLKDKSYDRSVDLFADALVETLKMDINLFIKRFSIARKGEYYVVAVEYLDENIAEDAVYLVCDWFNALAEDQNFDFAGEFIKLQAAFDKTFFGGPTFYSIYEAALKRDIPVFYLFEENQFQWGYGKKQIRGRSTTVSVDGIKDTEFTMYKDMVADFLDMCGFPTPKGYTCFSEEDTVKESGKLSFPVVVKPVAGHKGQGVATNILNENEVRKAYRNIVGSGEDDDFDGVIVQQQIEGTDHRFLSVKGKFAAALERVAAYVDGNGRDTIEQLIEAENDTVIRLDNARSPLCKIKIDDDLIDFLQGQKLDLRNVPREGERVTLRRVANISAGGVSINVTDKIHPKNIKLVEDIASFLNVTCLGIDVLADDISKPWTDGNFGIIEVNAGPGVFMHLAPAIGDSIDVPGEIMKAHFGEARNARIPIIAGSNLTTDLCSRILGRLNEIDSDIFVGSLTEEGVFFNGDYFHNNDDHNQNVKMILRHPRLDFALISHSRDDIWDYGLFHQGADIVILDHAGTSGDAIKRDLLDDGYMIEVRDGEIAISPKDGKEEIHAMESSEQKDTLIVSLLEKLLSDLVNKYD